MSSPERRRFASLLVVIIPVLLVPRAAPGGEVPFLAARVSDYAGILSPDSIGVLEEILRQHEDSTSNQVAVLTVASLDGETIEQYSMRVVDTWKLGRQDRDNGVLLLVAVGDREVRIEVGRGLEGDLPDIVCGWIIRNQIVPAFKRGDYDAGVSAGVRAILGAIAGVYTADSVSSDTTEGFPRVAAFLLFLAVVGTFTFFAVVTRGAQSWFLYLFLIPFWIAFPTAILGLTPGLVLFGCYAAGVPLARTMLGRSGKVSRWLSRIGQSSWAGTSTGSPGSSAWFSSSSSSFSGGGGSFSGGGASGSW